MKWGTSLRRYGNIWVVGPLDKVKYQHYNVVFHTSVPIEEKFLTIGAWIQFFH